MLIIEELVVGEPTNSRKIMIILSAFGLPVVIIVPVVVMGMNLC